MPLASLTVSNSACVLPERLLPSSVTHSMQQARRISDRTAFFLMGELVEHDDTQALFTNPRDDRTRGYVNGDFG